MNLVAQAFFLKVTTITRLLQINACIGAAISQAIFVSFGYVYRGALSVDFCLLKEIWNGMAGPTRSSD